LPLFFNFSYRDQLGLVLGFQHFVILKNSFVLNMMLLSINLVDPLFLSQFDAHAQFGSHEMLILGLALIETLVDTGVSQPSPLKEISSQDSGQSPPGVKRRVRLTGSGCLLFG
jgi:hypothetical protein